MSNRKSTLPANASGARRPTAIDMQIGALIRERRLSLGTRQEDLARSLGITPHQLQKYEVGENRIAASRLIECARILGVPVVWFYQSGVTAEKLRSHTSASLTASENELIQSYRGLSLDGREQLVSIAKVMQRGGSKTKGRSRDS